jgi:hypothetical protein
VEANEAPKLGWAAETDPTGGRDGIKAEDDPKLVEANEAPKLGWAADTDHTGRRDGIKAEDDPKLDDANEAPKLGWAGETDPSAMLNGKVSNLGCAAAMTDSTDSAAMTDSTPLPDANDSPNLAFFLAMLYGVKENHSWGVKRPSLLKVVDGVFGGSIFVFCLCTKTGSAKEIF